MGDIKIKLLIQTLEKKLEASQNYQLKKANSKYFWQFYQAYCLSCSILRIKLSKKDKKLRGRIYKNLILRKIIPEKKLNKINNLINEDMNIIMRAIEYLNKLNESPASYVAGFEKDSYIGIHAQELDL